MSAMLKARQHVKQGRKNKTRLVVTTEAVTLQSGRGTHYKVGLLFFFHINCIAKSKQGGQSYHPTTICFFLGILPFP